MLSVEAKAGSRDGYGKRHLLDSEKVPVDKNSPPTKGAR